MRAGCGLWHVADPGINHAGEFAVTAWCIVCTVIDGKLLW